jgi:hypothetical protein
MYFGFAFLYLLALGFYVLAWAFSRKSAAPIRGLHADHAGQQCSLISLSSGNLIHAVLWRKR